MTVIEADGVETEPVDIDQLTIYAAQRYSVILNANQTVGNYCKQESLFIALNRIELYIQLCLGIRVTPSAGTTGFTDGINSAILRYEGADDVDPTTNQTTSVAPLDESTLVVSTILGLSYYIF